MIGVRFCAFVMMSAVVLSSGCWKAAPPASSPPTAGSTGNKDKPPEQAKKTISITAEEFGKEWKADPAAAAKKFYWMSMESNLEITGTVKDMFITISNEQAFTIPCGGDDKPPNLHVVTKELEPWARYARGQTVTVSGRVSDGGFNIPFMKDAVVKDLKGAPATALRAADLAAEGEKDKQGTIDKYKGKDLIVTGEVAKISEDGQTVFLKSTGEGMIECRTYEVLGEKLGKKLKVGTTVQMYGFVEEAVFGSTAPVFMNKCLPITGAKEAPPP